MGEYIGQIVRGYEVQGVLGRGGFGAVYVASQPSVQREVAIKVILPEYANAPEFIRRFEAEAQTVARLEHPHIVPLYDYWRDPNGAYLVMRLVRGGTLREAMQKREWALKDTAKIVSQIGAALNIAHRAGVVHRDLKPSNILMDDEGNAYLSDFGIAVQAGANTQRSSTSGAKFTGSPSYISPEQVQVSAVGPYTDIYSFGIMLYELLMGRHPYHDAKSAVALMLKHTREPLPLLEGYSTELNEVLQKATAKHPTERYQEINALIRDFRQAVLQAGSGQIRLDPALLAEIDTTSFDLTPVTQLEVGANPYKGLRAFQEGDAADFFGREKLIKTLLGRLAETDTPFARFLAVVGPSGSGKSSAVKAGLIPALRQNALPNSETWFFAEMVPSREPMLELQAALLSVATNWDSDFSERMAESENGLSEVVKAMLPPDESQLVLVIDQFEELFTQADMEKERALLLANLYQAVTDPTSRLLLIVTLRADFYDRPLMFAGMSSLMQARTEVVIPLTVDELERVIVAPARQANAFFQSGLVSTIVSEVIEQPGVLPMLQYALTELFERREGNLITHSTYRDLGGVLGALARRAEEIYQELDSAQREATRQIFLRLVTLGEGTEDTRRRALQTELTAVSPRTGFIQGVIDKFARYRLVTLDRDPTTRTPTVEVAHEALIREWRRLRDWLDESRADVRLQRFLAAAAQEWENAKRENSFLLRGARLGQFEEWVKTTTLALTASERLYMEASIAERQRQRMVEEERRQKEIALEVRARRRSQFIIALLLLGFVVVGLLGILLFNQSQNAQSERDRAATQAQLAQLNAATALIAQGAAQTQALIAQDEAQNAQTQAAIAATQALIAEQNAATATIAQGQALIEAGNAQTQAAIAQENADIAATAQTESEREAEVSRSLFLSASANQLLESNTPLALALAIEANAVPNPSFQAQRVLIAVVFDAPRAAFTLPDVRSASALALSPDGATLVIATAQGEILLWDTTTRQLLKRINAQSGLIDSLSYHPSAEQFLSAGDDGLIILWDAQTGEEIRRFTGHRGLVTSIDFSPNGRQAVSGGNDSQTILWDVLTGQAIRTLPALGTNPIGGVDYAPDGSRILVSSDDAFVQWGVNGGAYLTFEGIAPRVRSGAFSLDGSLIVTSGTAGAGIPELWDANKRTFVSVLPPHAGAVNTFAFSPSGPYVLTGGDDFSLILSSTSTGAEIQRYNGHTSRITGTAFSPDGATFYSASSDGTVYQWDTFIPVDQANRLERQVGSVGTIRFVNGGENILVSTVDGRLQLFSDNGQTLQFERSVGRLTNQNLVAQLSPQSSPEAPLVAWGSTGVALLNMATNQTLWRDETEFERAFVRDVAFSPDGRLVAWGGGYFYREELADFTRAGLLRVLDAQTGQVLLDLPAHNPTPLVEGRSNAVTALVFDPTGQILLSGAEDGSIFVWRVSDGQLIRQLSGHGAEIRAMTFNQSGTRLLSASNDRSIIVWEVGTGELIRRLTGHAGNVTSIAFSPDESNILSGAEDGRLILWEVESGQIIRRFIGHSALVTGVSFRGDAKAVLSGAFDGEVILWRVDSAQELISWAQKNRYLLTLTCEQREQYRVTPLCGEGGATPPPRN